MAMENKVTLGSVANFLADTIIEKQQLKAMEKTIRVKTFSGSASQIERDVTEWFESLNSIQILFTTQSQGQYDNQVVLTFIYV